MTRKRLVVWTVAGAILFVAALAFLMNDRSQRAYAIASTRIVLTDPDEDDVADLIIKTRRNGDGSLRSKLEVEIQGVTEGKQYVLEIEIIELGGDPIDPIMTPPLTAQPPR